MTIKYDDWRIEGETVRIYLNGEEVDTVDVGEIVGQWIDDVEKLELYKWVG